MICPYISMVCPNDMSTTSLQNFLASQSQSLQKDDGIICFSTISIFSPKILEKITVFRPTVSLRCATWPWKRKWCGSFRMSSCQALLTKRPKQPRFGVDLGAMQKGLHQSKSMEQGLANCTKLWMIPLVNLDWKGHLVDYSLHDCAMFGGCARVWENTSLLLRLMSTLHLPPTSETVLQRKRVWFLQCSPVNLKQNDG